SGHVSVSRVSKSELRESRSYVSERIFENAAGRYTANASRSSARIAVRLRMKKSECELLASTRIPPLRKTCAALENAPVKPVFATIEGVTTTGRPQSVGACAPANGPAP